MEFNVHSSLLTQEQVASVLEESVRGSGFLLEDSSSLVVFPLNRVFRKLRGKFNPHDNVENAWFLVSALLSLSALDGDACIAVFDTREEDHKEDFFPIHFPDRFSNSPNARGLIHRGRVLVVEGCVDELSAVACCRKLAGKLEEIPWVPLPTHLSLPQRIKLVNVPRRLVAGINQALELFPAACLVENGNLDLANQLLSCRPGEGVTDCLITLTRFSFSVLHHKSTSLSKSYTELVFQGLAQLILENDLYEEAESKSVYEEWFSAKPLRQLFLNPSKGEEEPGLQGEADDVDWLVNLPDEDEGEEHDAWQELERELDNSLEFDGVLHESISKPVDFSASEFFRILQM
ncbi:hypothetical protein BASA81_007974 [Batrachochytrium salamandrivorans]|nr:hypothetical protein BASA81_007974 [Batrachochytrium salamandrivorans]